MVAECWTMQSALSLGGGESTAGEMVVSDESAESLLKPHSPRLALAQHRMRRYRMTRKLVRPADSRLSSGLQGAEAAARCEKMAVGYLKRLVGSMGP